MAPFGVELGAQTVDGGHSSRDVGAGFGRGVSLAAGLLTGCDELLCQRCVCRVGPVRALFGQLCASLQLRPAPFLATELGPQFLDLREGPFGNLFGLLLGCTRGRGAGDGCTRSGFGSVTSGLGSVDLRSSLSVSSGDLCECGIGVGRGGEDLFEPSQHVSHALLVLGDGGADFIAQRLQGHSRQRHRPSDRLTVCAAARAGLGERELPGVHLERGQPVVHDTVDDLLAVLRLPPDTAVGHHVRAARQLARELLGDVGTGDGEVWHAPSLPLLRFI